MSSIKVSVGVHVSSVMRAPYLHNHEYFALDRVLLVSVGVCVFVRARTPNTYTNHEH